MKYKRILTLTFSVLAAACVLLNSAEGQASTIGYHISVNTASLSGNPAAPFALDFQLTGGNPLGNTATVSNFTFGGGAATSTPAINLFGLAAGSLASSVTLNDNPANFFNEFFQGFTPGTALGFDVLLTTNVNTPTPDAFTFAILDKNLFNIPTTGLGDSLFLVNLNSAAPNIQTFAGTGSFSGVAVTAAVPEASSLTLLISGLLGIGLCWHLKRYGLQVVRSTRRLRYAALLAIVCACSTFAQSPPLFTPGNLLVCRSTYTGNASTVQFPGSLPNNAAASANGAFPNIFLNETPDPSFGVTSPILVDQLTRSGGLIRTIDVTNLLSTQLSANVATSFPSKSELGLGLTPDGEGVTFLAYGAAVNTLDVSNSNTPGHIDITNPVNGQGVLLAQRDIVELSASGTAQVTATNTYSGNNGRNVVLGANGNYYMVGNAGNNGSSKTFASGTVTLSGNSVSLSGASTTANMYIGTPFSGTNIPTGTFVTAITDSTHFTISAAATGAAAGSYIANEGAYQLAGISFTSGIANIAVADTSKLAAGMPLSGSGFAANSFIQSITDGTHFLASAAPTGNSSSTVSYTASVSNSMLSDNTGVQMIRKGQNDTTGTGTGNLDAVTNSSVVGRVTGVFGSGTGYQRGFNMTQIGAAADKTGKDDNFRGIANYKNTIYVTKGSGGNGFDAVYQINPSGGGYVNAATGAGLATNLTASSASINPLPGWPLTSTGANESKTLTTPIVFHPFGIWFANDTTLYVADEGASGVANAAPGGLEKWTFNSGSSQWELKYTLPASSIPGYNVPGIGSLQALGLRNISGIDNGDGTVTVFGITGTTGQTLNDEGADPNQLVSITDSLSAAALPAEAFNVIETAPFGDVLRGIAFVPGLAVDRSGYVRDRRLGKIVQQVTIQNFTSAAIAGPVYLVLDNLSANASLSNGTGLVANNAPAGSPYILIPGTNGGLAVGASAIVSLQFTDSSNAGITYDSRLLNGISNP